MFRIFHEKIKANKKSKAEVPAATNQFESLPAEVKSHIFSFFQNKQTSKTASLVCRDFLSVIDDPIARKFADPKKILEKISTLPIDQVMPFIGFCRHRLNLQFTDPHYATICAALTTTDIKTIDPEKLQQAIDAVSEEQKFARVLTGLRITKAAIENNADAVIAGFNKRIILLPYVNLSGADLAGFDFSNLNLAMANLENANLAGADLTDTILTHANLKNANLTDIIRIRENNNLCIMQ